MQGPEIITRRLEEAGISYCIVGGLASIAYGRPRLTLDADLVVGLEPLQVGRLIAAFPEDEFYLPPEEVLQTELQREARGHFNIIHQHSALRADCYLPGKSDLARWELDHRQRLPLGDGAAWFSRPEAVIVHKLLFYREGGSQKHLEDIRAMMLGGCSLDEALLTNWVDKHVLQPEWGTVTKPSLIDFLRGARDSAAPNVELDLTRSRQNEERDTGA